jgi:hypothetical protein
MTPKTHATSKLRTFSSALVVLGLSLLFAAVAAPSVSADPPPAPPGNDGECTHARSDQPCRPDPQPDHGRDCEPHSANFDGNEDHCGAEQVAVVTPTSTAAPTNQVTPTTPTNEVAQVQATPTNTPVPSEEAVEEVEAVLDVVALPASGSGGQPSPGISSLLLAAGLLLTSAGATAFVWDRKRPV